ncbi:thioredoxin family protein [Melioribacteraceae bacterium 4301-Me]|uniref:thioredoxin family protein n=1 Tax=Pyranulibacter aquaticus TaxID=3163344 RepID=UPI00359B5228
MKKMLSIFFLIFAVNINAQEKCVTKLDEKSGNPMLIGLINREAFADTNYAWWFDAEYKNYNVDSASLEKVIDKLNAYNIVIVMGTWCSDSRREVPRFFKILDYLKFPQEKIKMIAVDRNKKALDREIDKLNIEKVPDFIFYNGATEVGRIVESPKESLEKDISAIITK